MESHKTPEGVDYALLDAPGPGPRPTLFVFATTAADTLGSDYCKVGALLGEHGYLTVSLDLPCHSAQERPGETPGLPGWAEHLGRGHDFVADFARSVGLVIDDLLRHGWSDPSRILACGTSRGGYTALQMAARDRRFAGIVAFAPVTDLRILREFSLLREHPLVVQADLSKQAEALAGRPIWMCIGAWDERVGTDSVIGFTRDVVNCAVKNDVPPDLELHVMGYAAHTTHATAHDEAAAWILGHFGES